MLDVSFAGAQSSPPDPFVANISFSGDHALATLTERLDVWEVQRTPENRTQGSIVAQITHDQWQWLTLLGYSVTINQEKTAALHRPRARAPGQTGGIPGYACYRTVEETYADMAQLAADSPAIARWVDIGDTYDRVTPGDPAGYNIYSLVLTNHALDVPKGKLLVLAAVHAREYTTAETAARFAELLVNGYGVDPDLTWLLDYNEVHIIPQANPDGRKFAEQGYSWRKNTNNPNACAFPYYGVDLNRNASFLWNICQYGCSSSDACAVTYRGIGPSSEPETKAVETYIDAVFADQRDDDIYDPAPIDTNGTFITLHSYGHLVLYPWDWTTEDPPNLPELRRLGRKFGFFNRYNVCNTQSCLYPIDGSHTDYAYGERGVASYTIEMGRSFFESCSYFENNIVQPNLQALIYAAKSARRPYMVAAGPDVVNLSASSTRVAAGAPFTLTVTADDTRYFSNGYGVEPSQAVAAVRFSMNAPSWLNVPETDMTAADGTFDETVEQAQALVDTTGWTLGQHTIFVEAEDTSGNRGVPTALTVEIVGQFGLDLAQSTPAILPEGGALISHTLTVTNRGTTADTFSLRAVAGEWQLTMPTQVGPLSASDTLDIMIGVAVPTTVTTGAVDVAIIEVASTGDPDQVRLATLTTIVDEGQVNSSSQRTHAPVYLPLLIGESNRQNSR